MPNLFQFLDYRDFLLAYFEYRKKANSWYSYKILGDALSLDQSQVYRILQKQLHLSKAAIPRVLAFFKFSTKEAHYFEKLVAFAKSKNELLSRKLFSELLELRGSKAQILENAQLQLYKEWYFPIIRALLGCLEWNNDFTTLANSVSPPITPAQAKKAVLTLEKIGLIKRTSENKWELCQNSISTGSQYYSLVVKQYQAHTFQLAESSLDRHTKEERDFNVANMAIDQEAFEDCIAIIADARKQIRHRVEQVQHPDRIIRLATALFPVATLTSRKPQ